MAQKIHLVSWEVVCLPHNLGGLGLKRLSEFNVALLCKWLCRCREDIFWLRVVKEKYGIRKGRILPKIPKAPVGCSIWRGLQKVAELFKLITIVKVGISSSTSF